MTRKSIVPEGDKYVVTAQGRAALADSELCSCDVRLAGMFAQCQACGTVYGHVSQMFRPISNRYKKNGRT